MPDDNNVLDPSPSDEIALKKRRKHTSAGGKQNSECVIDKHGQEDALSPSESESASSKPDASHASQYTLGEEIFSAVTHGVGAALSIAALVLLIIAAAVFGTPWHLASAIVYGVTMFLLYMASTLYHAITHPGARHVFKIIDHASIYLLIAGTYTPFTLLTLRNDGGWWLFAVVWGLAIVGVATEAFWVYRPKWVSTIIYLCMGWLAIFAIKPIVANLPAGGVWLLIAGGLAYTLGTGFYLAKRVRYMHSIWHLWVLAGSILHFLAVMLYVFPSAS